MPSPETILWFQLRRHQLGYKFRRQYSVGRYVVDFYAAKLRLAIEIDGDSHFSKNAQRYDKLRQEFIEACGVTVIRFTNTEITDGIDDVIQRIQKTIGDLTKHPL